MATTAKKTVKKPVKKAAGKPAKAAKVTTKKTVRGALSTSSLFRLNLLSAVIGIILAVTSVTLLVATIVQLLMNYMTRDAVVDEASVVLAPAVRVFAEVDLRYVLCGIFAVGAVGSLLLATALKAQYEAQAAERSSAWRWALTGLNSALLLGFVSILGGVTDIATLKLVGGLVFVTVFLSWLAERQNQGAKAPKWSAYIAALLTGTYAWIPLVVSMVGTHVYGLERFGWHVYVLAGALLAGFIAFAVNQYLQIRSQKQWSNYLFVERNYLAIDLFIKVAVAAIILAALHS